MLMAPSTMYEFDELQHRLTDSHGNWYIYVFLAWKRFLSYTLNYNSPIEGATTYQLAPFN